MTNDLIIIADRLRAEFLAAGGETEIDEVPDALARQEDDGSWADIDYDDTSRTHWKPIEHLGRLAALARASRTAGSAYEGSSEVRQAYLSALRFWSERDPQSDNWWFNVIGAPRTLGSALVLMTEDLPTDLIEGARPQMLRSGFTRTGANLVWEASNLLSWACVTHDEALLQQVVDKIGDEIRITEEEGIQHDDSFYQHGPQNYALGYGRSFAIDVTSLAVRLSGTRFAFPDEKIRILSRLILGGQQWFVYGRQIDYHAMGREAFRGRQSTHNWNGEGLTSICENMRIADPPRACEYQAYSKRLTGEEAAGSSGPLGNKHFWRSDTMVHRAGDWYASVRFHSTRTYAVEARVNRENLQGYHLSDGVVFLMQRGDEYHDLQPVWDYRKLPGLTCAETDIPLPYGSDAPREGNTAFVGGASDGRDGVAVMDHDKAGVKAKKAYFFCEEGVVCLGAGITSEASQRVLTTLNQCRLVSDVVLLRGGQLRTLDGDKDQADDIETVLHDGVAYVLLEAAALEIRARQQSGSWSLVEERASDEQVPEDVFTCFIDHGVSPTAASYAYRMVPNTGSTELAGVAADASVRILANTAEVQAIHTSPGSLSQAAFHVPGALDLGEIGHLRVDSACIIQVRTTTDGLVLTVADPTQELRQMTVTIEGRWTGRGASYIPAESATRIVVLLPEGPYAGQSVICPLVRR